MAYNTTVYRYRDGQEIGCFVAEVDSQGRMVQSSAVQFSGLEGSEHSDRYLRSCGDEFHVVKDDCTGFRARIAGLVLPATYR